MNINKQDLEERIAAANEIGTGKVVSNATPSINDFPSCSDEEFVEMSKKNSENMRAKIKSALLIGILP